MWRVFNVTCVLIFCGLAATAAHAERFDYDPVATAASFGAHPPVSNLFVLGDSISEGIGAERTERSYAALLYRNDDEAYPQDAGLDLFSLFGPELNYVNVAEDGATSENVVLKQLPELARLAQGGPINGHVVVVMTVGGNDLQSTMRPNASWTGKMLDTSLRNVRSIIDFFRDPVRFPDGASIVFGSIYDITDGEDQAKYCLEGLVFPGFSHAIDIWARAYNELARRHGVAFVDMVSLFHGHGFNYANRDNFYYRGKDATLWVYDRDCVHPNNLGHHMLRRAFYKHIAREFGVPADMAAPR